MEYLDLIYEHKIFSLIIVVGLWLVMLSIGSAYKQRREIGKQFLEAVEAKFLSDTSEEEFSSTAKKREWVYSLMAQATAIEADVVAKHLRMKKRPAKKKAAEIEGPIKEKLRVLKRENVLLKTELAIFDESFPEFAEIREHILDSEEALYETSEDGDRVDKVRSFLSSGEYEKLSDQARNQLALDRYIARNHSPQEIGRMYERYLGYLWELDGWDVTFKGLVDGYEDLGRDLICKKRGKIEIVQAKNWSLQKTIHEKHIFQLYATKTHYCLENQLIASAKKTVKAIFATTTSLSPMALKVADYLDVEIRNVPLKKDYPMIKCNINPASNTKIYHLPFDQQYDKIKVGDQEGELYALTVKEAEKLGFRRAFRWRGANKST